MKQVQIEQNVVGRWQVPLGLKLMLGICRLSVLEPCMKHRLYLFSCMAVRQCYGRREQRLEACNLRCLLGIRRMSRVPNAWIRELCGVMKGVDERIDEGVLWLGHMERMEKDRIAKSVSVGECTGSPSVGKPSRRGIDTMKYLLFKEKMFVCQASKENCAG